MSKDDWDKLPGVKNEYFETGGNRIALDTYPNSIGIVPYASKVITDWKRDRSAIIVDTQYQEDLVGLLLAIAISYMSQKYHIPSRLKDNAQSSAIDRLVIGTLEEKGMPLDTEGTAFQIVCTEGESLGDNNMVNEAIISKVKHKHAKGTAYAEGLQLAVFVTQYDWKVDTDSLIKLLNQDKVFSGYWLVLPLIDNRFIVDYLRRESGMNGQGQIIIDISDGIKARHMGLYEQDHDMDDVVAFLKHHSNK